MLVKLTPGKCKCNGLPGLDLDGRPPPTLRRERNNDFLFLFCFFKKDILSESICTVARYIGEMERA